MTELDATAVAAPELPGADGFLEATRSWYATWCTSPQAAQFLATDWLRLHMLARLVDKFFRTESDSVAKQLMGEIRLNEQKLGGTPEDRLRLRWRLAEAKGDEDRADRRAAEPAARRRGDPRLKLVEGSTAA